jgi:hypothetical protein
VVDAADDSVVFFNRDQLGNARLVDGNNDGSVVSDLGAVEAPSPVVPMVTGFQLVNAATDSDVAPLADNAAVELPVLPPQLTLRATVGPTAVGSVRFDYDGTIARIENTPPYAIAGDLSGDYAPFTFTPGRHTVRATAYSGRNASGVAGPALTVTFTVVSQQVSALRLVNADNGASLADLSANATITRASLPARLTVIADTAPASVGSVQFEFDGVVRRVENAPPYALAGDIKGLYDAFPFPGGQHALKARVFSGANASGKEGTSLSVQLTIS